MLKILRGLLFVFLTSTCLAEIEIPSSNKPFDPIIASVGSDIPEGAEVKVNWGIESASNTRATIIPVDEFEAHVWARPGRHRITAAITWIQFEEVEITSPDGTKKVIKNLLGWDSNYYSKIFSVEDKDTPTPVPPDPNPPTPPTPDPIVPGPRWIIMIHNVEETNPNREDLWNDIWEYNQNNQKHSMVQIDDETAGPEGNTPDWLKSYLSLIEKKNVDLPAMVITTTSEDAEVLYVGKAPESLEAYQSLISEYGG